MYGTRCCGVGSGLKSVAYVSEAGKAFKVTECRR
jgi:hypothetical protein